MHYHGTPITPYKVLETLAGRHFCVSFANFSQIQVVHSIGQSVMLDNGAFTTWQRGKEMDWRTWREWVEEWLTYPANWCVLPDSVDGGIEENDELLIQWPVERGVPVWHLHEPLTRLSRLVDEYGKVCFGSSGHYKTPGSEAWHIRVTKAFDTLADDFGKVPWVHMLRGMRFSGGIYPFASVDSADIARNHNRPQNTARAMADRWDSLQSPPTWPREQEEVA
jgi:hypothetical protein